VPYRLADTLSELGAVTRGVCAVEKGFLSGIEELKAIERGSDGVIINRFDDGSARTLKDDTPVSMNFWGFPRSVLGHIKAYFDDFLASYGGELTGECYLPLAADSLVKKGIIRIRALEAGGNWFGVTYKEDREAAARKISALTEKGAYPRSLWE
ncbi:MAG: hypothetical protein LBH50_01765, partial [Spirochaetaceae bacterium]|nr:hypothetical protein [Spirochaetaceae bacterium]